MKLSLNDLVACLACLAAACHAGRSSSDRYESGARSPTDTSEPAASQPARAETAAPDSNVASRSSALALEEVLGFLIVVQDNEIAAAREALKKSIGPDAARFATMLRERHTEDKDATRSLAIELGFSPVENQAASSLREKASRELAELSAQDGFEFERAYVGTRIDAHEDTLRLIDVELIPATRNDELLKHLRAVRGHVAQHLEAARKLEPEPKQ